MITSRARGRREKKEREEDRRLRIDEDATHEEVVRKDEGPGCTASAGLFDDLRSSSFYPPPVNHPAHPNVATHLSSLPFLDPPQSVSLSHPLFCDGQSEWHVERAFPALPRITVHTYIHSVYPFTGIIQLLDNHGVHLITVEFTSALNSRLQ